MFLWSSFLELLTLYDPHVHLLLKIIFYNNAKAIICPQQHAKQFRTTHTCKFWLTAYRQNDFSIQLSSWHDNHRHRHIIIRYHWLLLTIDTFLCLSNIFGRFGGRIYIHHTSFTCVRSFCVHIMFQTNHLRYRLLSCIFPRTFWKRVLLWVFIGLTFLTHTLWLIMNYMCVMCVKIMMINAS